MEEFATITSLLALVISLILIYAIISIANSNVRIRRGIENIYEEIYKSNVVNDIHDKWDILKHQHEQEKQKQQAERKANKKGWF